MTFPRALSRYTRGAVNRMTLRFAGHAAFADLEHVGRKSGVLRHTPVRAFRTGDMVVVGLNFGRQADWFENIKAAGTCRMRLGNQHLSLGAPDDSPRRSGRQDNAVVVPRSTQTRGAHHRMCRVADPGGTPRAGTAYATGLIAGSVGYRGVAARCRIRPATADPCTHGRHVRPPRPHSPQARVHELREPYLLAVADRVERLLMFDPCSVAGIGSRRAG